MTKHRILFALICGMAIVMLAACGAPLPQNLPDTAAGGPVIGDVAMPAATVGVAYNHSIRATGGSDGNIWSIESGALPAGLTLSSAAAGHAAISGTPLAAGVASFRLNVRDSSGQTVSKDAQLTVADVGAALILATPHDYDLIENMNFVTAPAVTGGASPYAWALVSAPAWVTGIDMTSGEISGTAPAVGASNSYNVVINVSDSTQPTVLTLSEIIHLNVVAASTLTLTSPSFPDATVGVFYSATLTASGGTAPYTWSVISGKPPSINIGVYGGVNGVPSASDAGFHSVRVELRDSAGATVQRDLVLAVLDPSTSSTLAIDPSILPQAGSWTEYRTTINATGGMAPYAFELTQPFALPYPFELSADGVLHGVCDLPVAMTNTFLFQMRVTSSDGAYRVFDLSLELVGTADPALPLNPNLPDAREGAPYSFLLSAATNLAPMGPIVPHLVWESTGGTLPPGMQLYENLGSEGERFPPEISGIPEFSSAGAYDLNFDVWETHTPGYRVPFTCTLNVIACPFHIAHRDRLADGYVGQPYGDKLTCAGGQGAGAQWSIRTGSGALPTGLQVDPLTGTIAGIIRPATVPGAYTFVVDAIENGTGATSSFRGKINVNAAPAPNSLFQVSGGDDVARHCDGIAARGAWLGQEIGGLAFDAAGSLYVSESRFSSRVRKIDGTTRLISTVAGNRSYGRKGWNGPATLATVNLPSGVAADTAGNVYFSQFLIGDIVKVDTAGSIASVGAFSSRNGTAAITSIVINPAGTHAYITGMWLHAVVEMDLADPANWQFIAGQEDMLGDSGDGGTAGDADLCSPCGLGFDALGNLYVSELGDSAYACVSRVRKIAVDPALGRVSPASIISTLEGTRDTRPNSELVADGTGGLYYCSFPQYVSGGGGNLVHLDLAAPAAAPTVVASGLAMSLKTSLARDPIGGEIHVACVGGVYKIVK